MKKKTLINATTFILLIATIICVVTGIIKWPGLITSLGMTYRQLPITLITDLHDWSGIIMMVAAGAHLFQFRRRMMRMVRMSSVGN